MIYFGGTKSVPKYNFSVTELYDCYSNKDYLENNFVNYPHYAKRSLVWYIVDELQTSIMGDQCKLIQFHPSYTYEDFVRGIVSIPNEDGEGVLFKTENKILAEFAEKALKNKLNSQKGAIVLSKEKWLNEQFEKFIDFISDELEKNRKVELTESVFIIALDNDAFRYKGIQGWTEKGTRMLFKDIKQAFLDNNTIRQDLKHNQNVSRSAYWDATYFIKTVDLFRKFLIDEQITFVVDTTENEPLKNYVLIIDEINRANLPSVLGELIYALEYRDEPVESMYEYEGKREIVLPDNLYIIGTMNTADRSVGHIDYAIKRRFAFVDVLPTDQAIDDVVTDLDLNAKAKGLYHQVAELFNEDKSKTVYLQSDFKAKDVQLGHSYFLVETEKQLELKLEFEIKPLLNEYVKDGILSEEALLEIVKL
jgi:5-methylcytosine-specific restriction endonuclease McrBC GTP-binding regulatory subunit McrB